MVGYTPNQVEELGLTTQAATSLKAVGIGQPVYLKSLNEGTYTWSLTTKPTGSAAALSGTSTREVWFRIDMAGAYTVSLSLTDTSGTATASVTIHGGTFKGYTNCSEACHPGKITSWMGTGHATMLQRGLDGIVSTHYTESCIACHTTGYDTDSLAVNDGFDDRAKTEGWVFPDSLYAGVYANFVTSNPNTAALANIQCEACHGPASQHLAASFANKATTIGVSYDVGVCGICHDEGTRHNKPTEWRNSAHGQFDAAEFNRSGNTCVGCHTAEGFMELQVKKLDNATGPYADPHGQTCIVCHDPHDATNEYQLRKVDDQLSVDATTGVAKYGTDGTPAHACEVCHHYRPGRDYPGQVPHHSHQTEMLDGTAGWQNPSATFPATNPHGTLIEDRCVGCHMGVPPTAKQTYVGRHTFRMSMAADPENMHAPATDVHFTEACAGCHSSIGENFDYQGTQTKVTLMLNELKARLPLATSGRTAGFPLNDSTSFKNGLITATQLTGAFNYYIVDYDGSKGVHNPGLAVALLEDALDSNPKSAQCASCDVNGDGKLGIADAIKLILMADSSNIQACIDRNDDYVYDINDVIQLLRDIWTGQCGGGSLLAGASLELVHEKMDLTPAQVQYIEGVIAKLNLTPDQEAAFRIGLYGDGSGRSSLPRAFALNQNAPNPFNPATTISYSVPEGRTVEVSLKVYDLRGRLVATLVNEVKDAGTYTIFWEGTNDAGQKVASGVYFYRMQAGDFQQTRKMVVLK
ncbi:MAG: FlgD immunoglobulin-like domain containing protein [Candidatus Glassbacteria bacterium]